MQNHTSQRKCEFCRETLVLQGVRYKSAVLGTNHDFCYETGVGQKLVLRIRFQEVYTTRAQKTSRTPETAVPVLNLYYQTAKIQSAVDAWRGYRSSCSSSSAGNSKNTRVTPCKRLSGIPQLVVRKHAGSPKHRGDAILERLLGTRNALGQGPSTRRQLPAW